MTSPQHIDLLIKARWIIPVVPENRVLEHCTLAVHEGRILALIPQSEAGKRFSAGETLDFPQHLLIPGLVNAHGHAAMSLLRGYADDLPLQQWLEDHIWPAEARWVNEQFVHDGTQLAMAEMLGTGTTCFADAYFYPDAAAAAAQQAGMRAQILAPVLDFPSAWAQDADEYLRKAVALHDRFRSSDLITTGFCPHSPYTVSDTPLQRIATLAEELQAPIQIHLHETEKEVSDALASTGIRPLERLARLNLLSPLAQCIHMTQVANTDIATLQQTGASVVHCPESNLKLASGFCPAARLLEAGINLALGTDGAASNNDLDLLGEMRTAALLAKGVSGDAAALDAHQALRMATLNGAKALGLDQLIGSLEPGKAADLAVVSLASIGATPVHNPATQLVYTNLSHAVSDVWVNGQRLLDSGHPTRLNPDDIARRANEWQSRMADNQEQRT